MDKNWYRNVNYPVLVVHKTSGAIRLATDTNNKDKLWFDAYAEYAMSYRPASKEEILNVYYKTNKKDNKMAKYPKYKQSLEKDEVVKFTGKTTGTVIKSPGENMLLIGTELDIFYSHKDKTRWKKWKPKLNKDVILKENTVIHCRTKEEVEELSVWADNNKLRWANNKRYIDESFYNVYTNNTCYDIYNGEFTSLENATSNRLNILTLDSVRVKDSELFYRLPTINELLTLVDYTKYIPASNSKDIKPSFYWSSTDCVDNEYAKWCIDFEDGETDRDYINNRNYVKYVTDTKDGLKWLDTSYKKLSYSEAEAYIKFLNN